MSYREAGEDPEAKRAAEDAAEVGALRAKLAREGARTRRRELAWFGAGAAIFFAFISGMITIWNRTAPVPHRGECHAAIRMHDDGTGKLVSEPFLVCPDGGEMPPAPAKP